MFTQHYETDALDASVLLMPLVRFLPPDDERIRKTVLAIADELTDDGLVLRYRMEETDDGLAGEEGTFTICSFWLVSALVEIGEIKRARALCEKLLSYASPLGLYAEEIDPRSGRHLGNFPQAFTHLALINAVMHVIRADQGLESGGFPLRSRAGAPARPHLTSASAVPPVRARPRALPLRLAQHARIRLGSRRIPTPGGLAVATSGAPSVESLALYRRATNYIAAAMIYLSGNHVLEEPLKPEHIKHRLLGHWGTVPGLNLVYAGLNRLILETQASILLVTGPRARRARQPRQPVDRRLPGGRLPRAQRATAPGSASSSATSPGPAASPATWRRSSPARSTRAASSATRWRPASAPRSTTPT